VRIVSLVPSATETLLAWGVTPVACTRFCEQPGIRTVGGTKDPDVAAIVALAPDLVVVDEEENRREDAQALESAGVAVHVLAVRGLGDVQPQLTELGARIGIEAGIEQVDTERLRLAIRAFVPIWRRPWMTINAETYGSSVLEAIGVGNVFGDSPERYPTVTLDDVEALGPEVVIAPSEPYPFGERHRSELEAVAPVVFVDGRDLFWWGSRTASAVERLRAVLSEDHGA
jgi:ABC-type Fe3+-hydroxamate transport system substrate-binding protein